MSAPPSCFILGAGKVGRALARALRAAGGTATLRAARKGLPRRGVIADALLILAVRDRDLGALARELAASGLVGNRTACVHVAGALDAEILAPLRGVSAGVAQMHPMISFASTRSHPRLAGGNLHVAGDPRAVARARAIGRALGMTVRTVPGLDTVGYHAAAGLVANGAAALAAVGVRLLVASGVSERDATGMLGPLLASVADNVTSLGFPAALTGPVRRGDPGAVKRHLDLLRSRLPEAVPLFTASGMAQLPLARALAEAAPADFDGIERVLRMGSGFADAEHAPRNRGICGGPRGKPT